MKTKELQQKIIERRKRTKRPLSLNIFIIILLCLPFLNYFNLALSKNLVFNNISLVFSQLSIFDYLIIFMPFVIAVGVYSIQKWGWWLFLAYSVFLVTFNLITFFADAAIYNLAAVFQSFFGAIAIIFFTSKNISAPYMKMYPRGWRYQLRRPVKIAINILGKRKNTKDLSETGAFITWLNSDFKLNQELEVSFKVNDNNYRIKAGVVRITDKGIGIAFRDLTKKEKAQMRRDLQVVEKSNTEELAQEETKTNYEQDK